MIREYFTLGGCFGVNMSNAICVGVVTPLSMELAQWHCWEGLFSMIAFSRAHHSQISSEVLIKFISALTCDNSIGISKSRSPALMVHVRGCGLVLLTGMILTLVTGFPANLICFLGFMALFSGTDVSEI